MLKVCVNIFSPFFKGGFEKWERGWHETFYTQFFNAKIPQFEQLQSAVCYPHCVVL